MRRSLRYCAAIAAAGVLACFGAASAAPADPPGTIIGDESGAAILLDFQTAIYNTPLVNPPFDVGATVPIVQTSRPFLAIRTYIDPRNDPAKAGQVGGWVMPIAELRGLSRQQVLERWALPIYADGTRNNMTTLVLVPAGTVLWSGAAGPIHASVDGTGDWGAGGGTQYYVGWGAAGVNRYQLALTDYVLAAPLGPGPVLALGPRLAGNAGAVGRYLDGLSAQPFDDLDAVLTSLDVISLADQADAAPLAQAADQLSPERYGALTVVAGEQRRMFLDALDPSAEDAQGAWMRVWGAWSRHGSRGEITGFGADTWAAAGGARLPVGERLTLTLGLGYLSSQVDWRDVGQSAGRAHAVLAGAGLRYEGARVFFTGQIAAGYGWSRMNRHIVIADTGLLPRGFSTAIDRTAVGEPHGLDLGARADAGLRFETGRAVLRPFVGLEYGLFDRGGFTESGADSIDLMVRASTPAALRGRMGAAASVQLGSSMGVRWSLDAEAAASRRLAGDDTGVTAGLADQPGVFTVSGPRDAAWLFEPSLGVSARFVGGQARLGYRGEFGAGQSGHAASASLGFSF